MKHLLNLERYPLDNPESESYRALVERCKADIENDGMFTLPDFIWPTVAQAAADAVAPIAETEAFLHSREHNVYFKDSVEGLAEDHPALRKVKTITHTICADQILNNPVIELYEWEPFASFLAATMGKQNLYPMQDPLARVNVQISKEGGALNWHFDRSEFTTTILLQAPDVGGELEYRKDLRTSDDPNYDGIVSVLNGEDSEVKRDKLSPGALNVFCGVNTLHRVMPIIGDRSRIVSIFSFFDRPDVVFTPKDQVRFYGRASNQSHE